MAGIRILSEEIIYNAFIPIWGVVIAGTCAAIEWIVGQVLIDHNKSPIIPGLAILV